MTTRITEAEMASTVRYILTHRPNKTATYAELREIIPQHLHLTRADRTKSRTRPGEELWEQIVRNLVSHNHEGFVGVQGGIRLEWRGKPATVKHEARRLVAA